MGFIFLVFSICMVYLKNNVYKNIFNSTIALIDFENYVLKKRVCLKIMF